jgi:hypothetical protein
MYAYNPIDLFAIVVVAALPSTHNCFVQSEEEDLVTVRSHRLRSSTKLALLTRVRSPQIPYSNFVDTCDLRLHLRCSHHYYRTLLRWLGYEEERLPCRNPCSSVYVGHHLSSPGWAVFSVIAPHRSCYRFQARNRLNSLAWTACCPRCRNNPHARHMHREFKVPSGIDMAMLGPYGLNGWTPRPVHVFATSARGTDRATKPWVLECPMVIAPAILCTFWCLGRAQPDSVRLEPDE